MGRRYKNRSIGKSRRRTKLGASNWGPVLKLAGTVVAFFAAATFIVFAVMFLLETVFRVDTPLEPTGFFGKFANSLNASLVVSPTPYYTPVPTPTPHPMELYSGETEEKEIVFPIEVSYPFLADPYCFNKKIICSAGKLINGIVRLNKLAEYDINTESVVELPYEAQNDHLLFPAFNDKWLVYFDAKATVGGGLIRAVNREEPNKRPVTVKEVYIGQPELKLWDNYLAWIERTGTDRDKIFVCDLSTMETTVVQYFDKQSYGSSMPFIYAGKLIWAAEDSTKDEFSSIKYIDLTSYTIAEFKPGTYVHDPEYNGSYYAWLDSHHAENSVLYVSTGAGESVAVAEGVVEFGLDERFIAYGKDSAVYVYVFENGKTYRITPEWELTQFLGVSDGVVTWVDVTSRERDIFKFAIPPA